MSTRFGVGDSPTGVAYSRAEREILVANSFSGNVSVVNAMTGSVVANIDVGAIPSGVAFDSQANEYLVTNEGSDDVSLISGATSEGSLANVSVGGSPTGIATDTSNGDALVCDSGNGTLSTLEIPFPPSEYNITFVETGLETGTNWAVTLNRSSEYSITTGLNFSEPNGTYPFTIGPVAGYTIQTPIGNVTVNGTSVTVEVQFVPIPPEGYSVTFTESGLTSGTPWSVDFDHVVQLGNGSSITFVKIPNGSYAFNIPTVSGYYLTPAFGVIGVTGRNSSENVLFKAVPSQVVATASWDEVSATGLCGPPGAYSLTVRLFGNATGGVPPYTYSWNFGDGSPTSTLQETEHTYSNYPDVATLTVTDHQGNESSRSITIPEVAATCASSAATFPSSSLIILGVGVVLGVAVGLAAYVRKK